MMERASLRLAVGTEPTAAVAALGGSFSSRATAGSASAAAIADPRPAAFDGSWSSCARAVSAAGASAAPPGATPLDDGFS
jgi:hypothetical protein